QLFLNDDQLAVLNAQSGNVVRQLQPLPCLGLLKLGLKLWIQDGYRDWHIAHLRFSKFESGVSIDNTNFSGDREVEVFPRRMHNKLSSRMVIHESDFRSCNVGGGIRLGRRLIGGDWRLWRSRRNLALLKSGVQLLGGESCFGDFAASMGKFQLVQFGLEFITSLFSDGCRQSPGDPFGSLNHESEHNDQGPENDQAKNLPKGEPAGFWRLRVDVHGAYCAMSQRQFRLPSALSGKEITPEIA
ncbi:MAG TPA: hypothetical protein VJN64_14315, partial [Terriglobales bacterium]|nr:hypothetical protein [Terriglobales bacterium]